MKFLHISTGDHRGAFSGAYRLHRNLIERGHESFMFVGRKTIDDATVFAPARLLQYIRWLLEKSFSLMARQIFGHPSQSSYIFKSNHGFVPTFEVIRKIKKIKPDLVIVYYVADFLSERQLHKIRQQISAPMAFYLMDMGMLTGSCHYAWNCQGYQSKCADCPVTSSFIVKQMIARKWKSRNHYYDLIKPIIVSGSEQLSQQARLSGLTGKYIHHKILMGVNSHIYDPANRSMARKNFSFANEDLIIYFGAQHIDDKRKGFTFLIEALDSLAKTLSHEEMVKICLFTIGEGDLVKEYNLPFKHIHLTFISDQARFSRTYAAADVFVCPSVEDSGPMMINESMMSGTPVIAFDVGVAKDLVLNEKTGFKAPVVDSNALAGALVQFIRMNAEQRLAMRIQCRNLALQTCSTEKQVHSFVQLIQEIKTYRSSNL